jgi:hypothetical protein
MCLRSLLRQSALILCISISSAVIAPAGFAQSRTGPHQGDTLIIRGIPEAESVFVMMDARGPNGRCVNDVVYRTQGVLRLPNLPASRYCKSDVTVFSSSHRMMIREVRWSDKPDTRVISLEEPPVEVPVRLWITYPRAEKSARDEMRLAKALYHYNKTGIRFVESFESIHNTPPQITSGKCENNIREIPPEYYSRGMLNIYYIDAEFTGKNCVHNRVDNRALDMNVSFIGRHARNTTLAHEIAHALGLRRGDEELAHVDDVACFSDTNLMWVATRKFRKDFTLGQIFRMNMQDDQWGGTALKRNGWVSRDFHYCDLQQRGQHAACPLHWLPKPSVVVNPSCQRVMTAAIGTTPQIAGRHTGDGDEKVPNRSKRYRPVDVPYYESAILYGSSPQQRETVRRSANVAYDTLLQQARKNSELVPELTRQEFVLRYISNYDDEHRARGVEALAAIGTPEARKALENAAIKVKRPELRQTIQDTLELK